MMKCRHCESEWMSKKSSKLAVCPFCGKPLLTPNDSAATLEHNMKCIYDTYGEQILSSKSRLISAVRDLYANNIKLKNMLLNAIEYGVPTKLHSLRDIDAYERESRVHLIAEGFAGDFSLRPEYVYSAINCFTYALGYGMFSMPASGQNPPGTQLPRTELVNMYAGGRSKQIDDIVMEIKKQGLLAQQIRVRHSLPPQPAPAHAPRVDNHLEVFSEDASTQYHTGTAYYNGAGVTQDYSKAVHWFAKAAVQGHISAQKALGLCYHDGKGVEKDYSKAKYWLTRALEQSEWDIDEVD